MSFLCDGYRFNTTYWYEGIVFEELIKQHGEPIVKKIIFHIIAFEINKFASLAPDSIDFGPLADYVTPKFAELWSLIFKHVWGQWRFENNLPDYQGPSIVVSESGRTDKAISVMPGLVPVISFCGGGKDSLVAAKLLERAGIPFSSLAYASSIYGQAGPQLGLIDALLDQTAVVNRHRQWVYDDFLDSPVLSMLPDQKIKTLCAAETPSSIFGCMPFVLQRGYTRVVLGHERSADNGNMVWSKTGEEINHQWGKSYEAETAIQKYISEELIANLIVGSVLKPIYDVMIFNLLKKDSDKIKYTHSCNVRKPWCMKCPKCAYVWLNYMAYLPIEKVDAMFHQNLFDIPENQTWFEQLLGLAEHTPFECVGQPEETKIAFELCRRKGLTGTAMDRYIKAFPNPDLTGHVDALLAIDDRRTMLPGDVMSGILPQMYECQRTATVELKNLLKP